MISSTKMGIIVGALLALTWHGLGFWVFFFVAMAMLVGAVFGRISDGKLDIRSLVDVFRGKGPSS